MFALFSLSPCELIGLFVFLVGILAIAALILGLLSRTEVARWFGIAKAHFTGKFLLSSAVFTIIVIGIYLAPMFVLVYLAEPLYSIHPILEAVVDIVVWPLNDSILVGPLMAGLSLVSLKQLRGEHWHFGDFFGGFRLRWYTSMVGYSFVKALIVHLPLGPGMSYPHPDPFAGVLLLAGFLAMRCLQVRLGLFGELLILDRRMGAVEAVKANWKLSEGRFGMLFLFVMVLGLFNWAGFLFCGVGLLLTLPFTVLVTTAGYLRLTDPQQPAQAKWMEHIAQFDEITDAKWNPPSTFEPPPDAIPLEEKGEDDLNQWFKE